MGLRNYLKTKNVMLNVFTSLPLRRQGAVGVLASVGLHSRVASCQKLLMMAKTLI